MIKSILDEFNESNSTNYKLEVLKKYKDNTLLTKVLEMTYDRVRFTYGITMKNVPAYTSREIYTLDQALDKVLKLTSAELSGHASINYLHNVLSSVSEDDAKVIELIIGRDLKCNFGKTLINKVHKNLITKPSYMRCDVYSKKTAKNISFPAIIQLKADGTYREFTVHNGNVDCRSRSGESYEYPILFEQFSKLEDGVYTGELTVRCHSGNIDILSEMYPSKENELREMLNTKGENFTLPREISNGIINSISQQ